MNKWIRMTALGALLPVLMMVSIASMAAAPPELNGVWQGKLAVDDKTSLTIQFNFSKDAKGAYSAVLNSPDNPAIKDMPASGVTWDGTTLKLQVPSLQGAYSGTLKGGSVSGEWTQPGAKLPLVLAPYAKPVMTKQAAAALAGSWFGAISQGPISTTLQFRFKTDDKGEMQGTFSIPDQGLNDQPLSSIEFADNKLSLRIPRVNNAQYVATLANNQLTGNLKIVGPAVPPDGIPLSLKRGEYAPPVHALKFTSEQFAKVSGKWQGKTEITLPNGQKVPREILIQFETNEGGQYVGSISNPGQPGKIAVSEATLANDKLALKAQAGGVEFNFTLAGNTMTGELAQPIANIKAPLTLTKQ